MKKIILSIISIVLLQQVEAQDIDRSIRPKAGPAPTVNFGEAKSFVSSNGIKVFVVENHKLPRVSYSIDFDIKPALEKDMIGMAGMVGDLITAGTTTKSKDAFNKAIDEIGGTISVGNDGIYLQSLKKHNSTLLSLASDMLLNPLFPEDELAKLKKKAISGLATEKDDPQAMSRNISAMLNFGKEHYYGEIQTEQTISNISLAACKKYFETYFRPNVAYMAIVGDITLAEAKKQVEQYFGAWKAKDVPVAEYQSPRANQGAQVAIVNKSAAVQSVIDITYPLDLKPNNPDVIPLKVANGILGGGSTGRLFQNLREGHGWTYGSYSSINPSKWDNSATFSATANATADATDSSVAAILDEMKKMTTDKVKPEELEGYKTYMSGTFALGLEDPRTIARYAINIAKNNLPKDYYKNYLKDVEDVNADDVLRVSRKYIKPQVAHITVAGDRASNADKLKVFGPVTVYDIFGNVVKDEPAAVVPQGVTAQQVVEKFLEKTGGKAAWQRVKDVKQTMEVNMEGAPFVINFTKVTKVGNKLFMDINANGMTFQKIQFNGKGGKVGGMQGEKDIEGDEVAEMAEDAENVDELAYLSSAYKLELKGTEKVDGEDCYIVIVKKPSGKAVTDYYSMKSGLKIQSVSTQDAANGKVTQTAKFSDYKAVDGLQFPFKIVQSGAQGMTMTVKSVEINKGVEDSMFETK